MEVTRAELRRTLHEFRGMVRARGPREAMEVAALKRDQIPLTFDLFLDESTSVDMFWRATAWWDARRNVMPRLAARAVLRWWRWAHRNGNKVIRVINVGQLPHIQYDPDDDD